MIKNDSLEGSRLPEQATVLTSKCKFTSEFITPSAYVNISCNVFQSLSVTNFDLEPEEPELSKLSGFDDCENAYFRISILKRISQDVAKLCGFLEMHSISDIDSFFNDIYGNDAIFLLNLHGEQDRGHGELQEVQ